MSTAVVRGGLVKRGAMQLFLATETYNQLCLTEKQQSGAQPGCRSCIKLDQGLIMLVSFLLSLAMFPTVMLLPPL